MAELVGLKPGEFVWTGGDVHIYNNHFKQVKEQLKNKPMPFPKLKINNKKKYKKIEDFKFEDFEIVGYKSHKPIKAPIAV